MDSKEIEHPRLELRSVGYELQEFSGTGYPEPQLDGGQFVLDEFQAERDAVLLEPELEELKQEQPQNADERMHHDLLIGPMPHRLEGHRHRVVHLSEELFDLIAVGVGLSHFQSGQVGTIREDENLAKPLGVDAYCFLVQPHLENAPVPSVLNR